MIYDTENLIPNILIKLKQYSGDITKLKSPHEYYTQDSLNDIKRVIFDEYNNFNRISKELESNQIMRIEYGDYEIKTNYLDLNNITDSTIYGFNVFEGTNLLSRYKVCNMLSCNNITIKDITFKLVNNYLITSPIEYFSINDSNNIIFDNCTFECNNNDFIFNLLNKNNIKLVNCKFIDCKNVFHAPSNSTIIIDNCTGLNNLYYKTDDKTDTIKINTTDIIKINSKSLSNIFVQNCKNLEINCDNFVSDSIILDSDEVYIKTCDIKSLDISTIKKLNLDVEKTSKLINIFKVDNLNFNSDILSYSCLNTIYSGKLNIRDINTHNVLTKIM